MTDRKIIEANEFMSDDNLIKTKAFKTFLFKLKENELSLQMKPSDSNEVVTRIVKNLQ